MNDPIKIHPFDLYELIVAKPTPEMEYLGRDRLVKIGGIVYEETTAVPAITKAFE